MMVYAYLRNAGKGFTCHSPSVSLGYGYNKDMFVSHIQLKDVSSLLYVYENLASF
jgi:hypothetical protein